MVHRTYKLNSQFVLKILLVAATLVFTVMAGPAAADAPTEVIPLGAEHPLTGRLDATVPQIVYGFPCQAGQVASVIAETTAGDLVVDLTVYDAGAMPIISGRVWQVANVSAVEAFVMPNAGQCTVALTRAGNTAGTFALRLLPGYAQLAAWDAFDGAGGPLRLEWLPYLSDKLEADIRHQRLEITVMAAETFGYILPENAVAWDDFYVQADFLIDGAPSYYEYGFLLRGDPLGDIFYTLMVSADGDWSDYYFADGWLELQPWTVSPAIDGAAQTVNLGVWMQGNIARLYFNHRYVGEVSDPGWSVDQGKVGFSFSTGTGQRDWLTLAVDNLIITRPLGS